MPDDSKVCPQCATPVEAAPPLPPPAAAQPASTSGWLNVPPAQSQYPPQAQQYGQQYQQPQTEGKATASLVFGILSIVCFGILAGIPAIILGHISRGNIRRSMGRLGGGGMALAGLIMGYFSIFITLLIVPAIVIPNLLRSRMMANESAAASTVRTINTTQVTYSTTYPEKGYAPDLATLGPGPTGSCAGPGTADHACLLDNVLANSRCTAGAWCSKFGYNFSLSSEGHCGESPAGSQDDSRAECTYVVVATPVSTATGTRSFCSTSDGVVRYQYGHPLGGTLTVEQCSRWGLIL
ncbi:MAG: DUF4190 domain-containing protein [Candidatus Angelobacter sp.]